MPESPRKLIDAKSFGNSVPLVIGTASGEMDYVISRRSFKETYDKGKDTRTQCFIFCINQLFSFKRFRTGKQFTHAKSNFT